MQEYNVEVCENRTVWRSKDGKYHRIGGPAIEWSDGGKEWWVNGQRHRLDGPAVEWLYGHKEWHIKGVQLTEEQFDLITKYFKIKPLGGDLV